MTKNLGVTKAYCSRARIRGTLGDIDPRDKVTFQRAGSRVKKGPLSGVSQILARMLLLLLTHSSSLLYTALTFEP